MDGWLNGDLKKTCYNSVVPFTNAEQIELGNNNGFIKSSNNFLINKQLTLSILCVVMHKYNESYLGFGFTWTGSEDWPNGLCVIWQKIIQISSLAPAKIKRYFKRNQPS